MKILSSVCLALFLTVLFSSVTSAGDVGEIVAKLQKKYESIDTVEAVFTQSVYTKSIGTSEVSEGRVYFKKPGKWKWLYNDPGKGVFLSNGKKVWLYEPDFNQVLEKRVDALSSSITTDFLTGVGNLKEEFEIKLAEERPDSWKLELTPRQQMPNLKKLFLEVDKAKLLVVKTVVMDYLGNETKVNFKGIKVNLPIEDSAFEFTPPKGTVTVRP